MSFGARLLAYGALGSMSGVVLAAGMLVVLSAPAHAQTIAKVSKPGHPSGVVERETAVPGAGTSATRASTLRSASTPTSTPN